MAGKTSYAVGVANFRSESATGVSIRHTGSDGRFSVSAGVAVFPTHGLSASALLAKADLALYEAKHAGRDTWRIATGSSVPH